MNKELLDESISYYYDYLTSKLATKHSKDECRDALSSAYISMLGKDLKIVNKQHCCSLLFKESMYALYRRKDRAVTFEDSELVDYATTETPESNAIIKQQLNYLKKNASQNLMLYIETGKYTEAARILGVNPVTLRQQCYLEMNALRTMVPFKFIHENTKYGFYLKEDRDNALDKA